MSQDNLTTLKCSVCGNRNYYTFKNKRKLQQHKLELKKYCQKCKKHTPHTEAKLKK